MRKGSCTPSSSPSSFKKFSNMGPEDNAGVLEEEGRCLLCTSYTNKRSGCYLTRQKSSAKTCKVMEGNKVCCWEHYPMLHLSKNSYCLVKPALLMSSTPGPT